MPCCRPSRESEADAAARALGVDATNEAGPLAGAGGRCTDALCLLCIIACWLGLTILGLVVTGVPGFAVDTLPAGDPRRLLFGVDYLGDVCSVEEHTTYHADGSYKTYDVSALRKSYYLPSGAVVCVRACPSEDDARRFVCDYDAAAALDKHLARGDTHEYWSAGLAYVLEAVQLRVGDDRDLELLRVRRRARHRGGARGVGTDGRAHAAPDAATWPLHLAALAAPHARAHDAEADGRLHARADL